MIVQPYLSNSINIMAKKRELKKAINCVCSELTAECVAIGLSKPELPQESLDDILKEILLLQDDMTARICCPEPGLPIRKYFRVLRSDMEKKVGEIVDKLSALA